MAESKAAWDQVGEDFKALGRQVKQHYDQRPRRSSRRPARPRRRRTGARSTRPCEKLRESLEQAFSALGDAVRDPQVGEQTKKAAGSLSDALTATFAEASERFRKK